MFGDVGSVGKSEPTLALQDLISPQKNRKPSKTRCTSKGESIPLLHGTPRCEATVWSSSQTSGSGVNFPLAVNKEKVEVWFHESCLVI